MEVSFNKVLLTIFSKLAIGFFIQANLPDQSFQIHVVRVLFGIRLSVVTPLCVSLKMALSFLN